MRNILLISLNMYIYPFKSEVTSMIHCQCLCIDMRGHGDSKVDDEDDLSADTLAK